MFDIKIAKLPNYNEGIQKGMQRGIQKGIKKGILETLLSLLQEKYKINNDEIDNVRKKIEKVDEKKLLELAKLLLHISSYQDFKKQVENIRS